MRRGRVWPAGGQRTGEQGGLGYGVALVVGCWLLVYCLWAACRCRGRVDLSYYGAKPVEVGVVLVEKMSWMA